jgi:hypothetical protein
MTASYGLNCKVIDIIEEKFKKSRVNFEYFEFDI